MTNKNLGTLILILGVTILPLMDRDSAWLWGISVLAGCLAFWAWRQDNRWATLLMSLFLWSVIAFEIRFFGLVGEVGSLALLFLIGVLMFMWLLMRFDKPSLVLAYAAAIGLVEIFLILLFWPTNFSSRALVIVIVGLIVAELLECRHLARPLKSLWPALGLSALSLVGVVLTSDWFSF
ncbi:hypothetical protein HYW32_01460 [Candidatus Berkelbacteria bacterium]|nr:hypothetical protein [Candidatus Berkelbacteria bacterium]